VKGVPKDTTIGPSESLAFMSGAGSCAHEDAVKIEETKKIINKKKKNILFVALFINIPLIIFFQLWIISINKFVKVTDLSLFPLR
jgi:hypothetical protein